MTQQLSTPEPGGKTTLGHPSYIWTEGLERRLQLIRRFVPLEDKRILDIGCGIGTFVHRLRAFSPRVYGLDVDIERVRKGAQHLPDLLLSVSEHLPFRDNSFDLVLLHEVIEHVRDDRETLREASRVVAPGGHIVIFCPNRLYPFETHGVYLRKRYVFGNIPLVNYLPNRLRNLLVPHARAYTSPGLRRLWRGLPVKTVTHTQIYPGFDHLLAKQKNLGKGMRLLLYPLESTALRIFGLSHFVVLRKGEPGI